MENWRVFFRKSGTDIWTLIEQAIIVAAMDHSSEFKTRRSEIAETLFSRSLLQSTSSEGSCGKMDAIKASISSVLTNEDREVRQNNEKVVTHIKMERRVCDSAVLAASSGSVSMATDMTIETIQNNEGRKKESAYPVSRQTEETERTRESVKMIKPKAREEINVAKKCNESGVETESGRKSYQCISSENHQGVSNSETSYRELICIIDTLLQRDQNAILNCLEKLETMQLSLEMLKLTEIGKYVNGLRKHESDRIRAAVKRLVRNWKGLVDDWVECGSQVSDPAISGSNDGKQASKERISEPCQNVIDYSSLPVNDATFGSLNKTSVEMPEQLFSFLKDVFPHEEDPSHEIIDSPPIKDDSSLLNVKSKAVATSTNHPYSKEGKSSCTLVFKLPKKKEIHSSTELKNERISYNNHSSWSLGSKISIDRSTDLVPDSRGALIPVSTIHNRKLSEKVPTEKVDIRKRKHFAEDRQAENVKRQCTGQDYF